MPFGLPSEAASAAFLALLLAGAMLVAAGRRRAPPPPERVLPPACFALALHALHVAEEFSAGFHLSAPALLGLEPWSAAYFVWINMAAIAGWLLALAAFAAERANAFWSGLLWFLAIASVGNGLWHPAASLAAGGYFPGTLSALPLGAAGLLLVRALAAAPREEGGS